MPLASDVAELRLALRSAMRGDNVHVAPGTYELFTPLRLRRGCNIVAVGGPVTLAAIGCPAIVDNCGQAYAIEGITIETSAFGLSSAPDPPATARGWLDKARKRARDDEGMLVERASCREWARLSRARLEVLARLRAQRWRSTSADSSPRCKVSGAAVALARVSSYHTM